MIQRILCVTMLMVGLLLAGCGMGKDAAPKKTEAPPKEHVFTVVGVDVYRRTGPGQNFAPDGFYKPGERIKVLDKSNRDWFQVENPDKTKTWIKYWYLAEYVYGEDKTKPELIIFPRQLPGEVPHDIMEGKCVFTKGEIQLYKENRKDSEIIGKLLPEKRYQVTEFETQCGLNGNEIDVDGKKAKLLSYMGEGIYKCYVDGITKTLNTGTNQIKVGQMPQVWVRVKTESTEGWFSVGENVKNMHAGKSTGVFIPEKYPKDLIF
ncbi:MAG: SH3 domain-containing protein [Acidaminococcaceae bacterium]|nr:SH3 domain-containing protein [Acidaminococcaceae bacterium]